MTDLDRNERVERATIAARLLRRPGGLLDRLRDNLDKPASTGPSEIKSKGYESRVPWNSQAAAAYFVIVGEAVDLEAVLRRRLGETNAQPRPKTHNGALNALVHLPCLIAEQPEDKHVEEAAKHLRTWTRMARAVPGVEGTPRRSRLTAPCPFCLTPSLVVPADLSGDVVCSNSECVDPRTDKRPRWPRRDWLDLIERSRR